MLRAHAALGEDEIDGVEKDDTGIHENLGGDSEIDVMWASGPSDAEDTGYDPGHTEA